MTYGDNVVLDTETQSIKMLEKNKKIQ